MSAAPSKTHVVLLLVLALGMGSRLVRARGHEAREALAANSALTTHLGRLDSVAARGTSGVRSKSARGGGKTKRPASRRSRGGLVAAGRDSSTRAGTEPVRTELTPVGALDRAAFVRAAGAYDLAPLADTRRTGGADARNPAQTMLIDLDTAPASQIEQLPWIGPRLAAAIVADRKRLGPFGSITGLERVAGIGPGLSARIAQRVTFGGAARPSNAVDPDPRIPSNRRSRPAARTRRQ